MRKLILAAIAVALIGTATAQNFEPSHPLSQIHPVDVDLNMSEQRIFNISEIEIDNGLNLDGYEIREADTDGNAEILVYNQSETKWEIRNSDIDMNSQSLQNFFQDKCAGDTNVVNGVYPNGTYDCIAINQSVDDLYVNRDGDTMTGDLNMSQNDINNVSDITNYFENTCGTGEVVTQVYENGSYSCADVDEEDDFAQNLSEVLDVGAKANDDNINMTQQIITDIGSGRASFTSQGGLGLTGNLDLNNSNIRDIENLYRNDSQGNFFQNACGEFRAVKGIHPNGTYKCTDEILQEETESLNDTLNAGNLANRSIRMQGNNIVLEGAYLTNDTDDDGIRINDAGEVGINKMPLSGRDLYTDVGQFSGIGLARSGANTLTFRSNADGVIAGAGAFDGNPNEIIVRNPNSQPIYFETNGSERFRIAGDGEQISFNDLNMTEQNIQNIGALQDNNGIDSVVLDEENNLIIPNGNVDLEGNEVNDTSALRNNGQLTIEADSQDSNTGNLRLQTGGSNRLVALNDGQVRIPNGNLNLSQNQLDEVSRIDFRTGSSTSFIEEYSGDQLAINSQGDILRLQDSSSAEISAESNLRLNENDIEQVDNLIFNSTDGLNSDFVLEEKDNGDYVIRNGSTDRIRIDETVSIPNDDLDLDDNSIKDVSNLYGDDSSGNFFEDKCGQFRAVQGIWPNGTYKCTEEILEEETEGLNETLDAGNFAGPRDIYMNQSQIFDLGTDSTNFTDDGGLEMGGNISMRNQDIRNINRLNPEGNQLNVGANTDFNGNEIDDATKVGVNTQNPDENLDVEGTANISSSGTQMNVKSNGNVVITLG